MTGPDEILARAVERGDVFNVVAVAATADGILYQGAFGKRFVGSGDDVALNSIFRIASMSGSASPSRENRPRTRAKAPAPRG